MKRRKFIKNLSIGAAALGTGALALLSGCDKKKSDEKAMSKVAGEKVEWKMATTWPPHFPMLGECADLIAKLVSDMTDGNFKISVYGGGELVPPLGVFDAVSQGTVQMGHGASYYWAGKAPAAQFFACVPFGFNA